MNTILLISLLITTVIIILVLVKIIFSNKKPPYELNRIEQEIKDLRTDTVDAVNSTLSNFGRTISENQKEASLRQDKSLEELNRSFHNMAVENEQKLENIRQTMETKITNLTRENNEQLEKMRDTVDEKLQKTLEDRIGQSFKMVNERLEQVYKGLGEMKTLAEGVGDLKKVLSNVKTRGVLGEAQLAAILEQILSPEQYEENIATKPGSRDVVEFAIKLPGIDDDCVYLPIDAKFPGDLYSRLVDAYDDGNPVSIEIAKKELTHRIKDEAKDIFTKYIAPPFTTQYAILFLPFEGLYAEVLRLNIADELQQKYKVTIAGPTTIAALLNSLQMGFKTLAIQKHSNDVWLTLGEVKSEFEKFETVLNKAQDRLRQADKELDTLIGTRTRAINRKLKNVETLSIDTSKSSILED